MHNSPACQRTINNVTTLLYYAGSQVVEERDGSNDKICTYYYGAGGGRVARVDASNAEGFYHYDARGMLTHVSDGNGAVLEQYFYSAFGSPSIYDGSGTQDYGQVSTALGDNRALWAGRISESYTWNSVTGNEGLMGTGQIDGAIWNFYRSPVTWRIGPSGPLGEFLNQNNIPFVLHY